MRNRVFNRKALAAISMLAFCVGTALTLQGCRTTWQTPLGPVQIEPITPAPGTTTPKPNDPGTPVQHPDEPGRNVTGFDTDGDGVIDLIYDPVTKRWYKVTPVNPPAGNPPQSGKKALKDGVALKMTAEGAILAEDGSPSMEPMQIVGEVLDSKPLSWGNLSAEQWITNLGLNTEPGTQLNSELLYMYELDTEGESEITLFWSTAYALQGPWDYNLAYAIHALPSEVGGEAAMQVHVRGDTLDVARWLIDMGATQIKHQDRGATWTVSSNDAGDAVNVYLEGAFVRQIPIR